MTKRKQLDCLLQTVLCARAVHAQCVDLLGRLLCARKNSCKVLRVCCARAHLCPGVRKLVCRSQRKLTRELRTKVRARCSPWCCARACAWRCFKPPHVHPQGDSFSAQEYRESACSSLRGLVFNRSARKVLSAFARARVCAACVCPALALASAPSSPRGD